MKNKAIIFFATILVFLFFFNCAKGKFDLEIFGHKEAIGADVYINGSYSGKMKSFGGGSHYSLWLPQGTHIIEIRKVGYLTFKETINVKEFESEHFVNVELEKEKVE